MVQSTSFSVPAGSTTISIKVLDLSTIAGVPNDHLYFPQIEGVTSFRPSPSLSFLLEHPSGKRYLYDLGVPHDLDVLGKDIGERLRSVSFEITSKDPAPFLAEHGIPASSINGVIWSHAHWDHKGDMRTFPSSTDLIVGQGTIDYFTKGKGVGTKLGGVKPVDIEGRKVREINYKIDKGALKIGRFPAVDFFGDGSMYLLDSPGHEVGHMFALVRTTPETFVLLGGDAAHHAAEFRPSKYAPAPPSILPNPITGSETIPFNCGTWFIDTNTKRGRQADQCLYDAKVLVDAETQLRTIDRMQEADGADNVLVLIAHDASVRAVKGFPFFPNALNDWKAKGLGDRLHWSFVSDIEQALIASGCSSMCTDM